MRIRYILSIFVLLITLLFATASSAFATSFSVATGNHISAAPKTAAAMKINAFAPTAPCDSNGTGGGNWSDSATWASCTPSGNDAKILNGDVVIVDNASAAASKVEVQAGGTLNIPTGGILTTSGEVKAKGVTALLTVTGGTLTTSAGKLKAEDGGTINISSGTVTVDKIEVKENTNDATSITISGGSVTATETGNDSAKIEGPNSTLTVNGTGQLTIDGQLKLKKEGTLILPDLGGAASLTAKEVKNTGTIRQSGTATTSGEQFVLIENVGSSAVYNGVDITLASGTANITVDIRGRIGLDGDFSGEKCTNEAADVYRDRCFKIISDSTVNITTATKFYTTAEEDDITNDALFKWGSWINLGGCPDAVGAGGTCSPASDFTLNSGNNYFLIAPDNNVPTALNLTGFGIATYSQNHTSVFVIIILVLLVLGIFLVYHRRYA